MATGGKRERKREGRLGFTCESNGCDWSHESLFLKLKAGALPYHLRRINNFTSCVEANATTHKQHTRTTHTTRHYTTTAWEKSQRSRHNLRRYHQRCAMTKAATCCKLKWPPELLHHVLSPSSCTHKVVDLSALTLLRRNTPVAAPMKPPIPATLRGGPASSIASLLCQELRCLRLLRKGHLYSAITKITTAPSVLTRGYTPMGPPHLPANHGQSAPPELQHTRQHHQLTTTTAIGRDGPPNATPPRRVRRQ
jgi:hypothetical protein